MGTSIDPKTSMGAVTLLVTDLARSLTYYQHNIGLRIHRRNGRTAALGSGVSDLLILVEEPGTRPVLQSRTGLYHFAILVPSRLELARTLRHLGDTRTTIGGWSDHAVSEAIYLSDPDGHGIEIYRDRPRAEWTYPDGTLKLTVDPFDVDGVLGELAGDEAPWAGLHSDTVIGHVHLQVNDIPTAERFYVDLLGFDLIARYGGAASFVSAGGYHHHLGMNTWHSLRAAPPPEDAARLLSFQVRLPDAQALEEILSRLGREGVAADDDDGGWLVRDPAGNGVLLVAG